MTRTIDLESRYLGCLLGHALGDAVGAKYEGGPAGRLVWAMLGIGRRALLRTTDDTRMTLALAESLVEHGGIDADALALRWASDLDWRRGYGPGTARILRLVAAGTSWLQASRAVFPEGSYGNGAAMRAAPLGLYYPGAPWRSQLLDAARLASSITHAHPRGVAGGVLVALATALVLERDPDPETLLDALRLQTQDEAFLSRLEAVSRLREATPREVRRRLGCSVEAHGSVPTAVYVYLRFRDRPFPELMEFVVSVGGDTDTIGAMAGGLWGTARGVDALPADLLERLEQRARIVAAARALFGAAGYRLSRREKTVSRPAGTQDVRKPTHDESPQRPMRRRGWMPGGPGG